MTEETKKSDTKSNDEILENARVAYQAAVSLRTSRADELWSQFNALVTANSIILAVETFTIDSGSSPHFLSIGMAIIGLLLCLIWCVLHVRGVAFTGYYLFSAREIEERFLKDEVEILSRGGDFAEGKIVDFSLTEQKHSERMNLIGRILRVRSVAYLVILTFASVHLAILIWILFT